MIFHLLHPIITPHHVCLIHNICHPISNHLKTVTFFTGGTTFLEEKFEILFSCNIVFNSM